MEELLNVLQDMLVELQEINRKLDDIQGIGMNTSIADVCDRLDNVEVAIGSLETTISLQ